MSERERLLKVRGASLKYRSQHPKMVTVVECAVCRDRSVGRLPTGWHSDGSEIWPWVHQEAGRNRGGKRCVGSFKQAIILPHPTALSILGITRSCACFDCASALPKEVTP